jgi:hypothetical protein
MTIKAITDYTEAELESYEHIGNGKVLASLKTIDGESITRYTFAFMATVRRRPRRPIVQSN